MLRDPKVQAEDFDKKFNARIRNVPELNYSYVDRLKEGSYLTFDGIDFKDVRALTLRVSTTAPGMKLTVKLKDGKEIGTVALPDTKGDTDWIEVSLPVNNAPLGEQEVHIVASVPEQGGDENGVSVDWIYFEHDPAASRLATAKQ